MLSITLFVDDDATPSGDGLAWGTAYNDLQMALDQAAIYNTDTIGANDVDQIWIAEGTYKPTAELEPGDARSASFSLVDGVTLCGGFEGMENAIEERDWSTHVTTLSGNLGTPDNVLYNTYTVVYCDMNVEASINGVLIYGGNADGSVDSSHPERRNGGGIYCEGIMTITNSIITGNTAYSGGGVYGAMGNSITVIQSTVLDNTATTNGGGISSDGILKIEDSTVSFNSAGSGGGIFCSDYLILTNSTISTNEAKGKSFNRYTNGGGIESFGTVEITSSVISDNLINVADGIFDAGGSGISCHGLLNIESSIVTRNSMSGVKSFANTYGGGIFVGDLNMTDTIVSNNFIESGENSFGGGIACFGTANIVNSGISGNSATGSGGGIAGFGCTITVVNSTISGNSLISFWHIGQVGGGIYLYDGSLTLTNSTIIDNFAAYGGGGIYISSGNFTACNSVIAQNNSPADPDVFGSFSAESSHSLIGIWTDDSLPGENNIWGTPETPLNPLLIPMFNETGDLQHYRPLPDSPVVDAGDNLLAVDADAAPLLLDAVGNQRIIGDSIDIGAIERQDTPQLITTPPGKIEIIEGESAAISVSLDKEPSSSVTVTIEKLSGGSDTVISDLALLEFDTTNWYIPQTFSLSALENEEYDTECTVFSLSLDNSDTTYVPIYVQDNDPRTYVVDSLLDIVANDGLLTLREAVISANLNKPVADAPAGRDNMADTITFDSSLFGGTIALTGRQLTVSDDLDISGPGCDLLAIDGSGLSRVLFIDRDINATVSAITVSGGRIGENGRGGGIYNSGTLILDNLTVSGNAAGDFGGGIYNGFDSLSNPCIATLTIHNSSILGNSAGRGGGGIHNGGILTVVNSIIVGNSAEHVGGGIYSDCWGTVTITASEDYIDELLKTYTAGALSIINSTIASNSANSSNGLCSNTNGTHTISGSGEDLVTVVLHGEVSVVNTLFAETDINTSAPDANCNLRDANPKFVRNPSDGGDGWGDDPATPDIDESLNDDYGDLQLAYGSPAINAGSNELAVDAQGNPLATDIAGNPRIINRTVDIGAYESSEPARLPGDANLDKTVNNADALIVSGNWLMQSGATWADGDFNGDGRVDSIDATLLAANLHTTPDPPDTSSTVATEPEAGHVSCDLDNDGHVGLGDLALFASVYREKPGITTENPCAYAADFDRSGTVDLGDLALFSASYQLGHSDASIACRAGSQSSSSAPATALTVAEMPAAKTATLLPDDADLDGTVNDDDARLLALHWLMNAEDPDDDGPDSEKDAAHDLFFDTVV